MASNLTGIQHLPAPIGGYRSGRQSRIVADWRADRRIWAGARELDVQR